MNEQEFTVGLRQAIEDELTRRGYINACEVANGVFNYESTFVNMKRYAASAKPEQMAEYASQAISSYIAEWLSDIKL